MRLRVMMVCLLLLVPSLVRAYGSFNLTWSSGCWRDEAVTLRTFACDTNQGELWITGSVIPGYRPNASTILSQLDLQSDTAELPAWWQLKNPGVCRQDAMAVDTNFVGLPGSCLSPWPDAAGFGWIYWRTTDYPGGSGANIPGPNRAQLVCVLAHARGVTLLGGPEYYAFRMRVDFRNTVGAGACGGCSTPVTFVLNRVSIYSGVPETEITTPASNGCLRWQADGATPCSAVPVRNTTWGQVKGLYR